MPTAIRRKLGPKEGDIVATDAEGKTIALRPKRLIRNGQQWFWDGAWQLAEREADGDLCSERVHKFNSTAKALAFLLQQPIQSRR